MNHSYFYRKYLKLLYTTIFFLLLGMTQAVSGNESNIIINCKTDCSTIVEKVLSLGGTVTNKYQNVNAISVTLDKNAQGEIYEVNAGAEIRKDRLVNLPSPKDRVDLSKNAEVQVMQGEKLKRFMETELPDDYEFNNILTGAIDMNNAGFTGDGVIVAVIDSGTANNDAVVPALAGSVIGGENFVPGIGEPSATSTLNGNHGTWVGTMIAGHSFFLFNSASTFAQSVNEHMPDSIIYEFEPGTSVVPMFGSAPDASLYAMKTFAAAGGGAPESRIIAAMDRAITLRTNYNNGMPSVPTNPGCGAEENPCVYDSLNIQVVNMSLGGGTLYAGRDLEDQLTKTMLDVGMTLVASAGNEGATAITGGSPGTGIGTLTVGAASTVGNERVLRDLQFGFGTGILYRPAGHHQMSISSSRGPSADGRYSTDVIANGFACLVQGASGGISVVSGTSFSSPMVAGGAATLRDAFPDVSAVIVRNSLVQSANPNVLGDNPGQVDQGSGFIHVPSAYALINAGQVATGLPEGRADPFLVNNVKSLGIPVAKPRGSTMSKSLSNLMPGQVNHILIQSKVDTTRLTIELNDIVAELPAAEQNQLFGDDVYYQVQDAVTHDEVTLASGFVSSDQTIVIDNPQTGLIRLAVMGDWTNAGKISVNVSVTEENKPIGPKSAGGEVAQDEIQTVEFFIPDGTLEVSFALYWRNNWATYPSDDVDLIMLDPSGNSFFDGATLSSPERMIVANPESGVWTALVQGFTIHGINMGPESLWELRVRDQDGNPIPQLQ